MKTCPKCKEKIKEEATKCRYCKSNLNKETNINAKSKPNNNHDVSCTQGCSILFIVIILAVIFNLLGGEDNPETETYSASCEDAYVVSTSYVEQRLKSPSSAEFPYDSSTSCSREGNDVFQIDSYVNANNSFGTQIRTDWQAKLKYSGGDPMSPTSWSLKNITIR